MKEVVFVIGVSCAGKSTYIKKYYSDYKKVDLYDYQRKAMSVADVWQSYEDCKQELIESMKTCDKVVMEHTLLKKIRRIPYIEAVRQFEDVHLTCVLINPSVDRILENEELRGLHKSREGILDNLEILEIPEDGDGFDKIIIVNDFDI